MFHSSLHSSRQFFDGTRQALFPALAFLFTKFPEDFHDILDLNSDLTVPTLLNGRHLEDIPLNACSSPSKGVLRHLRFDLAIVTMRQVDYVSS